MLLVNLTSFTIFCATSHAHQVIYSKPPASITLQLMEQRVTKDLVLLYILNVIILGC